MYRAKSARSGYTDESKDHEVDSMEIELQKLRQRYRVSEGKRKTLISSRELQKRNQIEVIRNLESERENLNKNYMLATSRLNETRDGKYSETIKSGIQRIEKLKREIENEKQIHGKLGNDLKKGEKKTKNIRAQSATTKDKNVPDGVPGKKLNDLEGRLYRANSKYNQQLTENALLRKEIETLRIKYRNFQTEAKKHVKILKTKKEEINEVVEASQDAHEQREEAKHKTVMLQIRAEKDLLQYDTDIKEEERSAENDFQLKVFMEVKNQEREERNNQNSKKFGGKRREMEQLISKCKSCWEKIQEITQQDDLDTLLDIFVKVERENFAQFNFINEMNNNIEQQAEEIENIQKEYNIQEKSMQNSEDDKNKLLIELKERNELEKKEGDKKNNDLDLSNEQFSEIEKGLSDILKQIEVHYVIKNNIDLQNSLGIIENKINELIAAKALLMVEVDPENILAIKHILLPDPPAISLTDDDMLSNAVPPASPAIYEVEMPEPVTHVCSSIQGETTLLSISEMRKKISNKSQVQSQVQSRQSRKQSIRHSEYEMKKFKDQDDE